MALVLGAFEAWSARFDMNPDGIQYLDNAVAYSRGDFANALNTQWSPLYPWLIAAAAAIVNPERAQDFALAHAVNFGAYALSLASFLYFLHPLRRFGSTALALLAYSAFLYCSLDFTNLRSVTPDPLVSCFAFLVAGILVRIADGSARLHHFVSLGLALGLGCLAKAPFLPLAIIALALALYFDRKRSLLALAILLAVVAPYVAALSIAKGRFTMGDSAKLNLAWHVNGVPNTNWQGGPAENGRPIHPTRQLAFHPAIFEFAEPIAGTYPPWYDPAYWNEGVRTAYHPREFAQALVRQIRLYAYLLHHRQLPLLFALVALSFLALDNRRVLARLKYAWPVVVLGVIPFAMYAPVHAEGRYLASFFVLLWTAIFACILDDSRVTLAIAATAALLLLIESAAAIFTTPPDQSPAHLHFEIAESLKTLGLKPGDRVAIVTGDLPYYWAHLAGARISVQISFSDGYRAREAEWKAARTILAAQHLAFLVAPALDGVTNQPGWIPIATPPLDTRAVTTQVFAYPIRPPGAY